MVVLEGSWISFFVAKFLSSSPLSAVVPSRQQAWGRLCTDVLYRACRSKGHGPAWTHSHAALPPAAAKAEEAAAMVRSDDVTTAGHCSDFTAVLKLPLVHCLWVGTMAAGPT